MRLVGLLDPTGTHCRNSYRIVCDRQRHSVALKNCLLTSSAVLPHRVWYAGQWSWSRTASVSHGCMGPTPLRLTAWQNDKDDGDESLLTKIGLRDCTLYVDELAMSIVVRAMIHVGFALAVLRLVRCGSSSQQSVDTRNSFSYSIQQCQMGVSLIASPWVNVETSGIPDNLEWAITFCWFDSCLL